MSGIYKITNTINHKVYVGRTNQPFKQRWKQYRCDKGENRPIAKAFRKYGIAAFHFEILELIDRDQPQSVFIERESYWIKEYDSFNSRKGYNRGNADAGVTYHRETSKRKTKATMLDYRKSLRDFDRVSLPLIQRFFLPKNVGVILSHLQNKERNKRKLIQKEASRQYQLRRELKKSHRKRKEPMKFFLITFRDGQTETVSNMARWCSKNGFTVNRMVGFFLKKNARGSTLQSKYAKIIFVQRLAIP